MLDEWEPVRRGRRPIARLPGAGGTAFHSFTGRVKTMRILLAVLSLAAALVLPCTAAAATQRVYPPRLPADIAHPGSAIVAFKTPVTAAGDRFAASPSGNAGASDIAALNSALSSIGATHVRRLFTNIPADRLAAARVRAEAATGK